jgi:hypothetical protein
VRIVETGPRHRFLYSYPASAAAIPSLDSVLRKEAREELTNLRESAKVGADGVQYPITYDQQWSITADTPNLLAMSSISDAYWGGPHGEFGYRTLIWGKSINRPLVLAELFSKPRTAFAGLTAEFCRRFRTLRAARLREGGETPSATRCPEAEFASIVPVAGRDRKIRGFRMLLTGEQTQEVRPGGSYEFDIPLSPAIRRLVRPRFAASLAPPRRR